MLVFGIMDGLLVGLSRVKQSAAARGQVAPAAAAAARLYKAIQSTS